MDSIPNQHNMVYGMSWYMIWSAGHGMVYGMAWRAWQDMWYGLADMPWYGLWYGLADMALYTVGLAGMHGIWYSLEGHGVVYGISLVDMA